VPRTLDYATIDLNHRLNGANVHRITMHAGPRQIDTQTDERDGNSTLMILLLLLLLLLVNSNNKNSITRNSATAEIARVVPINHTLPTTRLLGQHFFANSMDVTSMNLTQLAPERYMYVLV